MRTNSDFGKTGPHNELDDPLFRADVARAARVTIPELVQRINDQVQVSVPPYAGLVTGRRRRLIDMAVTAAINHYLDSIESPTASSRSVDELFRRMGHGEATDGHELVSMQAAFRIASQEAWEKICTFSTEQGLTAGALGRLGDALFAYMDHLSEQARLGHDGATRLLDKDPNLARQRLIDEILEGAPNATIRREANTAAWTLPALVTVIAIKPAEDMPDPSLIGLDRKHLVRMDPLSTVIVADSEDLSGLFETLNEALGDSICAKSWPVPLDQAADAWRWTTRALALVECGVIPAAPIVDCSTHRTQLWLHAEPPLRQSMCLDLLQPLLAETPNSREILSETLLAWLESRDSAPAIAARLGVHPQTVRYRWKRINELFGEDLRDPEFVVQVTMLLKASVPLWKAGDQSDLQLFRAREAE